MDTKQSWSETYKSQNLLKKSLLTLQRFQPKNVRRNSTLRIHILLIYQYKKSRIWLYTYQDDKILQRDYEISSTPLRLGILFHLQQTSTFQIDKTRVVSFGLSSNRDSRDIFSDYDYWSLLCMDAL